MPGYLQVLMHFSSAYAMEDVQALVTARLPDWLRARTSMVYAQRVAAPSVFGCC